MSESWLAPYSDFKDEAIHIERKRRSLANQNRSVLRPRWQQRGLNLVAHKGRIQSDRRDKIALIRADVERVG